MMSPSEERKAEVSGSQTVIGIAVLLLTHCRGGAWEGYIAELGSTRGTNENVSVQQ